MVLGVTSVTEVVRYAYHLRRLPLRTKQAAGCASRWRSRAPEQTSTCHRRLGLRGRPKKTRGLRRCGRGRLTEQRRGRLLLLLGFCRRLSEQSSSGPLLLLTGTGRLSKQRASCRLTEQRCRRLLHGSGCRLPKKGRCRCHGLLSSGCGLTEQRSRRLLLLLLGCRCRLTENRRRRGLLLLGISLPKRRIWLLLRCLWLCRGCRTSTSSATRSRRLGLGITAKD